ncbi:MAG TPA: nucleotidyltransferase family protein, partial [Candidatus Limnocylindrales bacterium]
MLSVAVPRWGADGEAALKKLLEARQPMDWAYFLDQALRQQVVSMVGRNLSRHLPKDKVIVPHLWIYSAAYEANARRNRSLFTEFGRILAELNRHKVRHAVRKGPSLCALVYDDPGMRWMNDLDILIERGSLEDAIGVLVDLGYAQGVLSANGSRVVAYERKTKLFWAVHLNNALPFVKPTTDPEVQSFEVDLCLDLFQKRSSGRIDVGEVLDRARPTVICGERSFALSPLDQLIDICLHLYKEATSYLSISRGRDLNLLRFIDVTESLRATPPGDLARLPRYAQNVGAQRELYYVLYHASLLYPHAVPDDLLELLEPQDRSYLDEY